MIEKYSNIYIGLVVNNQDPNGRGRVQVFIPHITSTLYKGWNDNKKDKKFRTLDSANFSLEIVQKLVDILPWSEVSMPFFGGGTGAPIDDTGTPRPMPTFTYGSTGGITPSTSKPVEHPKLDGLNNGAGLRENSNVTTSKVKKGMKLQTEAEANNASVAYKTAYDESIRLGANPTQANTVASAIVGNIAQESFFNTSKVHDGGIGYGLLGENQDIRTRMEQYAASKGESISNGGISTKTQIEALFREPYFLENKRKGNFNNLKNMSNVPDASLLFAKGYLLPVDATANYEKRANYAVAAANTFSNVDLNTISGSGTNTLDNSQKILAKTTNSFQNVKNGTNTTGVPGGPIGISSIPQIGSKAYVMFLDGNPLQPIVIGCYKEPTNV